MAAPRAREWLEPFTPEVISDLRRAARATMRQICDHEPDDCECSLNMYTPMEWVDYLDDEATKERGKPVRLEPAGRPGRKDAVQHRLNLSAAS